MHNVDTKVRGVDREIEMGEEKVNLMEALETTAETILFCSNHSVFTMQPQGPKCKRPDFVSSFVSRDLFTVQFLE